MVTPEFVVDAVQAGLYGSTDPAWYEVYIDETAKTISLVRHDDLQELFGWRTPSGACAIAVVAGGRARSLPHPEDGDPAEDVQLEVPAGRLRVMVAVDRDGAMASRTMMADGTELDGGCQGGRLIDAMHRTLDLPTLPPPTGSAALIVNLWLAALAESIEATSTSLTWDDVAGLHPAVVAVGAIGEALGDEEREAMIALTPRVWTWERLREDTADGAGIVGVVSAEVAAWMDDGMFARWALDASPDRASLWGLVAAGLDEDAAVRLAEAIDHADDPRMSGAAGGYGTGMPDHTLPSKETRAEEAEEARQQADPGRGPTPDEEAAADSNELAPGVAEHEKEMTERGAHQAGEGKLP